jgi:hypothetical protein
MMSGGLVKIVNSSGGILSVPRILANWLPQPINEIEIIDRTRIV